MKTKFSAAMAAISAASALACSPSVLAGSDYAVAPIGAVTDNRPTVTAQAGSGTSYGSRSESRAPMPEGGDRYGSPAGDMPYDREIRVGSSTRGVNVARNETIKFVTAEGREFRWRFDTFRAFEVFPLSHIAPADVAVATGASIYVTGDIPIAP